MSTQPRAVVVVVNWNGAHLLPPCLDAVRAQTASFPFETWVVDNASTDGSVDLLRERYPWVRVLRSGANRGFAGGNNVALREVTAPFAVLLNNDAVPAPDWLERLLAPFDGPDGETLGATTGKVVFAPRFVRLRMSTPGFVPGPHDTRELGVRIGSVRVDGTERIHEVLWERFTYGAEGPADGRFFWTRPAGEMLLPVPAEGPVRVEIGWAADGAKPVRVDWELPAVTDATEDTVPGDHGYGCAMVDVGAEPGTASFEIPAQVPRVDVINNVGGIVLTDGYGADRGYQEVDTGQYDKPEDVFTFCGNGVAMRSAVGHELGWFDDDFFLYYEDTDLAWRLRARGHGVRYVPDAVLRHLHSATSVEWSPLFVFHTDRNRLLMLTKDASLPVAVRNVLRYPATTASMALRAARQGWASRQRPPLRPTLMRLRVIASYLRLLPVMVRRRRGVGGAAVVPRRTLERMLVPHPPAPVPAPASPSPAEVGSTAVAPAAAVTPPAG